MALTGGHWASLSAATSWTLRCLVWDFPLVLISLVNTCFIGMKPELSLRKSHFIWFDFAFWWSLLSVRRSWHRPELEPGRFWTLAEGGWRCLHLKQPTADCGRAQRYAPPPPGSELQHQRAKARLASVCVQSKSLTFQTRWHILNATYKNVWSTSR